MKHFLIPLCAFLLLYGCEKPKVNNRQEFNFKTEYQAVLLDNGQYFFGKLENADSEYPLLKDVFYVRSEVNRETKEAKGILIKRGNEWHGPDIMYINAKHIVVIEPVSPESKVAQLIKEEKIQK